MAAMGTWKEGEQATIDDVVKFLNVERFRSALYTHTLLNIP